MLYASIVRKKKFFLVLSLEYKARISFCAVSLLLDLLQFFLIATWTVVAVVVVVWILPQMRSCLVVEIFNSDQNIKNTI